MAQTSIIRRSALITRGSVDQGYSISGEGDRRATEEDAVTLSDGIRASVNGGGNNAGYDDAGGMEAAVGGLEESGGLVRGWNFRCGGQCSDSNAVLLRRYTVVPFNHLVDTSFQVNGTHQYKMSLNIQNISGRGEANLFVKSMLCFIV